jgi:geranylgeranyl pyrophosphate synthase
MTPPAIGVDALSDYLETERARAEAALERALAEIEPRLVPDVARSVRYGLLGGGKRLRPILCVAAYAACGKEPSDAAHDLAASLELVHAYSLMHDDLPCMDDAELRRGRATAHKAHGEEVVMRAGLALIPAAALHALRACRRLGCPPARARAVTGVLLRAAGAGGMVGGQWMDLEGEGKALGAEVLDDLHRRKTGALLAASLEMGALAASAPKPVVEALREYGGALGLAFQIADDVLDATQSAEALGKHPSDVARGKATYVALYGLEEARRRGCAESERAVAALSRQGITAPVLEALARYVVERAK